MGQRGDTVGAFQHAEALRDCVHCGLCLTACPTYLELGNEADSPRGRIYLMRGVAEGAMPLDGDVARHLDLCLGCRACESACPSGVRYGSVLEDARVAVRAVAPRRVRTRLVHATLAGLVTRPRLLERVLAPLRWFERWGLMALGRRLSRSARLLPRWQRGARLSGKSFAPESDPRAWVVLFEGCVARVLFAGTNAATVRVLLRNDCAVAVPEEQGCCGALLAHAGDREAARELARRNVDGLACVDGWIITNAGGCGAMLREYGELLADDPVYAERARAFAARVRDVSEFLDGIGLVPPAGAVRARVAYHEACHLAHGQGVRAQPRALLRRIRGVELVEIAESELCCGAAGSYNLTEPAMAARLGARKAERIAATDVTIVAAGNPGCVMQIQAALAEAGVAAEVLHPVELLDRAYAAAPDG